MDTFTQSPDTPLSRSIPTGFVRSRRLALLRPTWERSFALTRGVPLAESEVVRICLADPSKLDSLARTTVDLKKYPGLVNRIIEAIGSGKAVNMEKTVEVLKRNGVQIGWNALQHGAKHLKSADFLKLLKHGPSLFGQNAADMLARCVAGRESLARDVISSDLAKDIRPRLIAAVGSFKPELASIKAEVHDVRPNNPFFAPRSPGFDRGQ